MFKRIVFIFLIILFLFPQVASAKVLPQSKGTGGAKPQKTYGSSGKITVYPVLRWDKRALVVTFGSLQNAKSVSYLLTYQSNGVNKGVEGTVPGAGSSVSREILFGTCSGGTCVYHTNIFKMTFQATASLTNGKTQIKKFRIKI